MLIAEYSVRSKHNLRFYAIKVLSKEKIVRMKQVSHTRNEQQMLMAVQHPFIINLWGSFQDSANLYMVMDFVPGGELFTLLRRSNVSVPSLTRPRPNATVVVLPTTTRGELYLASQIGPHLSRTSS